MTARVKMAQRSGIIRWNETAGVEALSSICAAEGSYGGNNSVNTLSNHPFGTQEAQHDDAEDDDDDEDDSYDTIMINKGHEERPMNQGPSFDDEVDSDEE